MEHSKITKLKLKNFTAFKELEMEFSPGINIFIGDNGTGKTHILKILYSAVEITKSGLGFTDKLLRVFLPSQRKLNRLINRKWGAGSRTLVEVYRGVDLKISSSFDYRQKSPVPNFDKGLGSWNNFIIDCAYIPVKEMLANAPKFLSMYSTRDIHFEEVYPDIINRANRPIHLGPYGRRRSSYINTLKKIIKGRIYLKDFEFILQSQEGHIEFTLLAEGMRKLALILLLIQNDTLIDGSMLFWDEPEANLNPSMLESVIKLLLELQRDGVQIFIATHNYIILRQFDQLKESEDNVKIFSLYRDPGNKLIKYNTGQTYQEVYPNKISEAYSKIYEQEILKSLGGK